MAALRGCVVIDGDLALGGAVIDLEALAELVEVRGSLTIGPSYRFDNASGLRGLRRVHGNLVVAHNGILSGLFLSALESVGGNLQLDFNPALRTISAPHLGELGGRLSLDQNGSIERVDLPGLPEGVEAARSLGALGE